MPDGVARGLPKHTPESRARFVASSSAWNPGTEAVSTPTGIALTDFVVLCVGIDGAGYGYIPGASQDAFVNNQHLSVSLQGTNWHDNSVTYITLRSDQTAWPSALSHNQQQTNFDSLVAVAFRPNESWIGVSQGVKRSTANATSLTCVCPTNLGPRKGGIAIASAGMHSGGAGPNSSVTGTGWNYVHSGGLGIMAYYYLSERYLETPPNPTFTAGRSTGWAGSVVYIV